MKRKSITYYVSSVNGKDTNDGLTEEYSFQQLCTRSVRENLVQETVFCWKEVLFLKTSIFISEEKERKEI